MLFSLRSTVRFSSAIAASVLCELVDIVPVPAVPVVTPGAVLRPEPEDCAVPALFVPGGGKVCFDELPTPAEPASGEPTAPCANEAAGEIRIMIAAITIVAFALVITSLPFRC